MSIVLYLLQSGRRKEISRPICIIMRPRSLLISVTSMFYHAKVLLVTDPYLNITYCERKLIREKNVRKKPRENTREGYLIERKK
jgi:hypothetical protein